jgi:DNA invertase Pin-like site-specific DNA recombinase
MREKPGHKSCSQPIRCAIYARTATLKKSNEDNSITRQVGKCKCFAKRKEWIVGEDCIFTDSEKSGLAVNSGLKDLMRIAAVNPKPFDVLLCTSIDRIARDTGLVIRIYEALKKYGVEVRFAECDDT